LIGSIFSLLLFRFRHSCSPDSFFDYFQLSPPRLLSILRRHTIFFEPASQLSRHFRRHYADIDAFHSFSADIFAGRAARLRPRFSRFSSWLNITLLGLIDVFDIYAIFFHAHCQILLISRPSYIIYHITLPLYASAFAVMLLPLPMRQPLSARCRFFAAPLS
jgi:hypothetical protein